MAIVNDALSLLKNYSRNQNLDITRGIQVINTATQFVKAQISMPGGESEYEFLFFEDQSFYPIPQYFSEPIFMRFSHEKHNRDRRFEYKPGEYLFERIHEKGWSKHWGTRLFGIYTGTGTPQLMVIARNRKASLIIDSFNSQTNVIWTAAGDASNLRYDPYTFADDSTASLAFDVTSNVANRAALVGTAFAMDFTSVQNVGHFRLKAYIPEITNFTSVSVNWGSDNADYFKQTVTEQYDGTPFVVGWNKLDFPWDGTQTQVGSPNVQQITYFDLDFDYTGSFSVPITGFRVDDFEIICPDKMKMNFYTTLVGTTVTGTPIVTLSATTDVFLFSSLDPAIMELVAVQAAVILNPQIIIDDKSVRQIYADFTTLYKRNYPRKKINNLMADPLPPRTS